MILLDVRLDNFYAFRNFHMNLTYPKKIVGSTIENETLSERPNFRYKKVNIIMGANATGKTSLGRMLTIIFNFIVFRNIGALTECISERKHDATFSLDMAATDKTLYRIFCEVKQSPDGIYTSKNIKIEIRQEKIRANDSYESCIKRLERTPYLSKGDYAEELDKMGKLDWLFEYPKDTSRKLSFPHNDALFETILGTILKTLDPSIQKVEKSNDIENAYVVRLRGKSVLLQDGEPFTTDSLSSGTKAGVEVAQVVSALLQGHYSFYYCDEKFPYISSDAEKAILSLMIDLLDGDAQLFFTTHNTDILDMDLPKHSFLFLRKDASNENCPITCVDASAFLKRSTDSVKSAVENDLFSTAPAVDQIYNIANLKT